MILIILSYLLEFVIKGDRNSKRFISFLHCLHQRILLKIKFETSIEIYIENSARITKQASLYVKVEVCTVAVFEAFGTLNDREAAVHIYYY